MSPERFREIETLFYSALEVPPDRRDQFLESKCEDDSTLRAEVASLLAVEGDAGGQLAKAVADAAGDLEQSATANEIGKRIGNYLLVREVGRGGMGIVYQAIRADDQYMQAVAIKLVRQEIASEFALVRSRVERQILARLEHPNIASLLDGGTTDDGRPYFVMQYIEGQSILDYCRDLPVPERLRLFRSVCAAVHYAHQKLVIHRDIKPTNVHVTNDGTVKLLDFGIAKLLAADVATTEPDTGTAMSMMTPEYASPEQIRGEPLTTATDIYSLGVLLYELMAGRYPYRINNSSNAPIAFAVCEQEPPKLSDAAQGDTRLRKAVAGDIENIVAMAMRKEPERRYGSAEQFSEDILRHLEGRPVIARKDTLMYRTGKLVRRNKLAVGALALLIVSLMAGMAATTYQARRAERHFEQVRNLADSVIFGLNDRLRDLPGATAVRAEVVKTALVYLDSLVDDSKNNPELRLELARAYEKIGDVQGSPFVPNLGKPAEALASYRKGLRIIAPLNSAMARDPRFLRRNAELLGDVGSLANHMGDNDAAMPSFRQALASAESLAAAEPTADNRILLAESHTHVGNILRTIHQQEQSIESYRAAIGIYESIPQNDRARRNLTVAYSRIANAYMELGHLPAARETFERSRALREELSNANPKNLDYRRNLIVVNISLGNVLGGPQNANLGRQAEAEAAYRRALQLAEETMKADAANAQGQSDFAYALTKMGEVLRDSRPAEAVGWYRRSIELSEKLWQKAQDSSEVASSLAQRYDSLAHALENTGKLEEAEKFRLKARDVWESIAASTRGRADLRLQKMASECQLCALQTRLGREAAAQATRERVLPLVEEFSAERKVVFTIREMAECYEAFGALHAMRKEGWDEARGDYGKSLETWKEFREKAPDDPAGARGVERVSRLSVRYTR